MCDGRTSFRRSEQYRRVLVCTTVRCLGSGLLQNYDRGERTGNAAAVAVALAPPPSAPRKN